MFGPVSGAHFNPVVSLVDAAFGGLSWRDALAYIPVQIAGCITGAVVANAMFELAAISISDHPPRQPRAPLRRGHRHLRADPRHLLARAQRARRHRPAAVGAYIGAAYWFTSSTSFANPAITRRPHLLRHLRRHRPRVRPGFIVAQLVGGLLAFALIRTLYPDVKP